MIRKLLVANRGEIARRIFRTCRERGIATVAVFSEADRDAPHVAEADEAVAIETYLGGEAIVEAARRTGVDAVHPGYGFLAENAGFARLCREAGLSFVGPSPEAIAAMGSKLQAKAVARQAGVPLLAETAVDGYAGGFPVLVKASAGGGGRGMRVVRSAAELGGAVDSARREAASAFGDDTVFLEPWLEGSRHVEVQVFGDAHGNVVSLFERECSIQRRHQKVLEESPSPAVDDDLRAALGRAALAIARAVRYQGAGTVEFLLRGREFLFLEMNTRLQVEHAVTECVTGLDLVALQIHVAEGGALPEGATLSGHAIEARLYAEDPERGFLPTTGTLHRFRLPFRPGIRMDAGVEEGSAVGTDYDPLLAKLIAHAPTRAEAAARLASALDALRVHGVVTNRELLAGVLRHPEFLAGATDTVFLERHPPASLVAGRDAEPLHAMAAALGGAAERRRSARLLGFLPSGWRNNPSQDQETSFEGECGRLEVRYRWGRSGLRVRVGETEHAVRVYDCRPDLVDLEVDGVRRRYEVHRVGDTHYVDSPLAHSALREVDRFPLSAEAGEPGSLRSPLPGRVVRLGVRTGDAVEAGAVLAVIEAMKMEHQVTAPRAGRVSEVRVREGQQLEAGAVLAVLESI